MYKVRDLDAAVADFRSRGFVVEYGAVRRPKNALVYFSRGPYLELLVRTGMPRPVLRALAALPANPARRFNAWERGPQGLCGLCLEGKDKELDAVVARLHGRGLLVSPTRVDPHGRHLRYRAFFPADLDLPFFMTHFSVDPRPADLTHPNGIRSIAQVDLPLEGPRRTFVSRLCDDGVLRCVPADGTMRVVFDDGTELREPGPGAGGRPAGHAGR